MAGEAGGGTAAEKNEDGTEPGAVADEAGGVAGAIVFGTIGGPVVEDTLARAEICLFLR